MGYAEELKAFSRVPQAILALGVPRCENLYAQTRKQHLQYTEDIGNAVWTLLGGATRTLDVSPCPREGEIVADRLVVTSNGDGIEQISDQAAASRAFTYSAFICTTAGSGGTITIEIADAVSESRAKQITLPEGWSRFAVHKKFTAGASGNVRVRVKGVTGDSLLGSLLVRVWGHNLTENVGALDQEVVLQYVKRTNEADTVLATMCSRCQAADAGDGIRCTYTGMGCQDPANYNSGNQWSYPTLQTLPPASAGDPRNGIREYLFCLKQAPLPVKGAIVRPMLRSFDQAPQEIDGVRAGKSASSSGGFVTRNETANYELEEEADPGNFDLDKASQGALTNTGRGSGSFWPRWLATHPNYDHPSGYARLSTGFVFGGTIGPYPTLADFKRRIGGPISSVAIDAGGVARVEGKDVLHVTKRSIPSKISSTNLLLGAIDASVTSMSVDDPTEVSEPAPNAAATETFDSDGARTGGPDWVVTLLVGTEEMNITAKTNGGNPLTVQRGRWGTTAASHANRSSFSEIREFGTERTPGSGAPLGKNPIDCKLALYREAGLPWSKLKVTGTPNMIDERDTWVRSNVDLVFGLQGGVLFRRMLTDQEKIDDLLQAIDRDLVAFQFVDEDGLVNTKVFAGPRPNETLIELTDVSNFSEPGPEIQLDLEARLSRVVIGWDLIAGKEGGVLGDYSSQELAVDSVSESGLMHGSIRDRIVLSKWIRAGDSAQGQATALRILARFVNGARLLLSTLEAKDDDDVRLGSFCYVTTSAIQTALGATASKVIMLVTKKERSADAGRMRITFLDTAITRRLMFVAPVSHPDYDAATADQRRYGFVGDTQNRVGVKKEDGYYVR